MGRLFNLLVVLSVLWSGLHLLEPAAAPGGLIEVSHAAESAPDHCPDSGDGSGGVAHSHHHHCPVASEPRGPLAAAAPFASASPFFAAPAGALPSLAHAPPLQPPTA